jgi:hypothetical protein
MNFEKLAELMSVVAMSGGILTSTSSSIGEILEAELNRLLETENPDPKQIRLLTAAILYIDNVSQNCIDSYNKFQKCLSFLSSDDMYSEQLNKMFDKYVESTRAEATELAKKFGLDQQQPAEGETELDGFDFDIVKKAIKSQKLN